MSFKSIFSKATHLIAHVAPIVAEDALKGIGVADNIAKVATPFLIPYLGPEAASIEAIVNKGVDWAESAIEIEQQGAAKKQGASAIVTAELTNAAPVLAAFGLPKNFVPTPATISAISTAIDAAVASRNALNGVLESLKPPAAPAPTVPEPAK